MSIAKDTSLINRIGHTLSDDCSEADDNWCDIGTPWHTQESSIHSRLIGIAKAEPYPEALPTALRLLKLQFKWVFAHLRFDQLAKEWKDETGFLSNVTTRSMHPTYQQIIGLGDTAVSFILKDLKDNGPDDWFWALTSITGENPITENIAGNMKAMTEAWLQWGIKTGYLKDSDQNY